jgi:hypothetical protein
VAALPVAVPVLLIALYAILRPPVPDLAAQVARAQAFAASGADVWWTGWFAGLSLPTYSVITPGVMAAISAPATGALAALVTLFLARGLMRGAPRPGWGTLVFGLLDVVDLVAGRVTFAVGLALGLAMVWALCRRWPVLAAGAGVLCCLASPLAGLFAGLVSLAVLLTDRSRRMTAACTASALVACGGGLAVLFPDAGVMPTTVLDVLPALGATAAVALLCRLRVLRVAAALVAGACVVFLVMPGAVGTNVTRLVWLAAAPLIAGYGRPPERWGALTRGRAAVVVATAVAATALAPALDLTNQLRAAADRSASAAFYLPLVRQLRAERSAAGSVGQRVEVVDPRTHWSSVYVARQLALARGWNRQVDAAVNPLFYVPGALDARSYTAWLHSLAVGWVAVPDTPLDYAATAEARLVDAGVPALRRTWAGDGWTLYQVRDATSLVQGARLEAVRTAEVIVDVTTAGPVLLRIRWSPTLGIASADGGTAVRACPGVTADGMVRVELPVGRWHIGPDVGGYVRRLLDDDCR